MPIEDVSFLLKHSDKENVSMFIDSSTRDRMHYRTPSEYVVDFEEPVRNIYGIDILDGSVPNSQFNVDNVSNHIRFVFISTSISKALVAGRVAVGANTTQLADESDVAVLNSMYFVIGYTTPARNWASNNVHSTLFVAYTTSDYLANTNTILKELEYTNSGVDIGDAPIDIETTQYVACVKDTLAKSIYLIATTMSNVTSQNIPRNDYLIFDGSYYIPRRSSITDIEIVHAINVSGRAFALVLNEKLSNTDAIYDIFAYRITTLTEDQWNTIIIDDELDLVTTYRSTVVGVGQYTSIEKLQIGIQYAMDTRNLSVEFSQYNKTTGAQSRMSIATSDRILLPRVSCYTIFGFDLTADLSMNSVEWTSREQNAVLIGGDPFPTYCSVLNDEGTHTLDSPGMIILLGERYIKLRCPEIEQYIESVNKYGQFATGIGVFRLANVEDITQVRFDYINLVKRPIHPIARLARLTFRFESLDGELVDFKGINHQLLISLKYYKPVSPDGVPANTSILNPDYDPDMMKIMSAQTAYAKELEDATFMAPDSDDNDYTSSTSNDDDDDDTDTSDTDSDNDNPIMNITGRNVVDHMMTRTRQGALIDSRNLQKEFVKLTPNIKTKIKYYE